MNVNFRNFAVAAALLLVPTLAQAEDSVRSNPAFGTVADLATWSAPNNVVGGGVARLVGTGEEARVEYSGPVRSQAGLFSRIVGSGEDARIVYSATPDRDTAVSEAEGLWRGGRG